MIVNQWIPAAHRGDAVGDSARKTRDLLRRLGHQSEIYALTIDEDMRDDALPFALDGARAGDVTIFHYALPSPMTSAFARLPRGRVLQYHNVTPARFFADFSPAVFRIAAHARQDLASLVDHTELALGVSDFNRRELETLGFRQTSVLPIALDLTRITTAPPHPVLEKILGDGLTNFLFVGAVTDWELAAYYRTASVYVSLSEHEGFAVPLLEAMAARVPVFAYDSSAISETLGGAGVCWSPKDLEFAAELLGQVAFDRDLREKVIAGQLARLDDFSEAHFVDRLQRVVQFAETHQ